MQALEDSEKLVNVFHVEAGPVVSHENHEFAVHLASNTGFNLRWVATPSVFDRVGQKVDEHLLQQCRVPLHLRQRPVLPEDIPALYFRLQAGSRFSYEFIEI